MSCALARTEGGRALEGFRRALDLGGTALRRHRTPHGSGEWCERDAILGFFPNLLPDPAWVAVSQILSGCAPIRQAVSMFTDGSGLYFTVKAEAEVRLFGCTKIGR